MFESHHNRHVWIYRKNPNGVFAPINPAVICEHHIASGGHSQHTSGN